MNNTNNTLVFRNLVQELSAGTGDIAYGIRYSDSNYNNEILENAVKQVSQAGGGCGGSSLAVPTVGAVAISAEDEALDALAFENLIDKITSSCTAIGVYSDAWGGLENTRNGQQIPIVTDVVDNKIDNVRGQAATVGAGNPGQTAAVALAPITPANPNDHNDPNNPPSSFRVLANNIDHTGVAVAVLMELAPSSYIRENDFDGDNVGVFNSGSGSTVLDATNNWWGCVEGPASGKKECATIVGPAVSYTPWLKHHVDHAGAHAGDHAGHG